MIIQRPKIAFDCRQLRANGDGMSRACIDLIHILKDKFEMHLLTNDPKNIFQFEEPKIIYWHSIGPKSVRFSFLWENTVLILLLLRLKPKIYHAPFNNGIPFIKLIGIKYVSTIHDLIPIYFPKALGSIWLLNWRLSIKSSLRSSDYIITDSDYSYSQIIKYYPKAISKIKTIPCFISDKFKDNRSDDNKINMVKTKYKIYGDYFIYHGGYRPHKNVAKLISTYNYYRSYYNKNDKLCLIGSKKYDFERHAMDKIKQSPYREDIITPGFVEDQELSFLLSGAKCMIYLSLMEGFGYPPLEAAACGTPVICAKNSSLAELLKDSPVWVINESSEKDIADKIYKLMSESELRDKVVLEGLANSKRYSREAYMKDVELFYNSILS